MKRLKSDDINKILNNPEQKMNDFKAGFQAALSLPEVKAMKEAVAFYADENNWEEIWVDSNDPDDSGDCACKISMEDVELKRDDDGNLYYSHAGKIARKALADMGEVGNGNI